MIEVAASGVGGTILMALGGLWVAQQLNLKRIGVRSIDPGFDMLLALGMFGIGAYMALKALGWIAP